jgi:hypothetical protein
MKSTDLYLNKIQDSVEEAVVLPVLGTLIIAKAIKSGRNLYKKSVANYAIAKKCEDRTGYSKQLCKSNAKIRAWTKYKNEMRRWMAQCAKAKNEDKCKKQFETIMKKVDNAIAKEKAKLVRAATKT